ncbi:DNA replication/repair protein RecF [Litoreibacter janthinus]|uniref:DNA replication and repair protein RecF n=1 Tax=Litoreibacter janthinus TaxID=670154 RepID=A0A1I6FUS7_9RHOB|nr:DNA replication/repair protein RecF [Litoreibacter janthinus]SFR33668.1 DNA replication and repair protein RecF [Litoreibacter janthinus]
MAGLYLSALTLSHFRSHRRVELELDNRPIAIFGSNGAGKTNILEAISLLSPGRGLRRAKADEIARAPEALGWKVSSVLHSLGQIHEIDTSAESGSNRTVKIDGKTAPQVALGKVARIVWLVPAMDRLWLEGAEGRRRFLDRITLSFEPKHAELSVSYEKAMRERNRLLKDMVRDSMWYGALEAQMAKAGAQIIANRTAALNRLKTAMESAHTSFPTAELSIENPDDSDFIDGPDALLAAFQASRTMDLRAGRTLVGPHRADMQAIYEAKNIEAKQCSTGEQKALLLSLILANARALSEDFGAAPIILLDEVAAHLDSGRRAALYDEICALGAQAWMTGTGAELFEELGDRAQQFEVSDDGGTSLVELR